MKQKLSIGVAELRQLLNSSEGVTLIDVRSKEEYNEKHILQALHITVEEIETGKVKPDLRKPIVTVCGKGGGRSEKAARLLLERFTAEVYFLEGGTLGWFEDEK